MGYAPTEGCVEKKAMSQLYENLCNFSNQNLRDNCQTLACLGWHDCGQIEYREPITGSVAARYDVL